MIDRTLIKEQLNRLSRLEDRLHALYRLLENPAARTEELAGSEKLRVDRLAFCAVAAELRAARSILDQDIAELGDVVAKLRAAS